MISKENLKKNWPIVAGACAALVAILGSISAQAVETAIGSDVARSELRAITIESWDNDYTGGGYGWEAITSADKVQTASQAQQPAPAGGAAPQNAPYEKAFANVMVEREVKLIPGTPGDIRDNVNYAAAKVFAVKFAFTFPGYNVVTLRPPRVDHYMIERPRPFLNEIALASDYKQPNCFKDTALSQYNNPNRPVMVDCLNGIDIPGVAKKVSVWVMGRGNEYELEGWIEDWRGNTHILKFGSVDFIGWRPLLVDVPNNVPQDVDSYPATKTLVFRQFKLRAKPTTSLETVYIFFDELRVLSDIFEVHFDGAALDFDRPDCERKNRLVTLIRQNARYPDHWPQAVDCSKAPGPAAPFQGPNQGGGGGGGGTP